MVRITWSSQAVDDLKNISEYISRDSVYYARLQIKKITERTKTLKKFPHTGKIVPEINHENIREVVLGNYRIIYEIYPSSQSITILTIHHSSRNFSENSI